MRRDAKLGQQALTLRRDLLPLSSTFAGDPAI